MFAFYAERQRLISIRSVERYIYCLEPGTAQKNLQYTEEIVLLCTVLSGMIFSISHSSLAHGAFIPISSSFLSCRIIILIRLGHILVKIALFINYCSTQNSPFPLHERAVSLCIDIPDGKYINSTDHRQMQQLYPSELFISAKYA